MEANGLVSRHVQGVAPVVVDYRLTSLGRRFAEAVGLLYAWARTNADALDESKERPGSRRSAA